MSELQTVDRAGHIYIRKDETNVVSGIQYPNCFIGIVGLEDAISGLQDHVDRHQTNERLILDDKDATLILWPKMHVLTYET